MFKQRKSNNNNEDEHKGNINYVHNNELNSDNNLNSKIDVNLNDGDIDKKKIEKDKNNDNSYDKIEQERKNENERKVQIILEKEFSVITGAILTVSECLKFCLSEQNNGIERNSTENNTKSSNQIVKNTASLIVHSQQYGNSSNLNSTNSDSTGTLPYALLISAGLAVISSCALLLGQSFRPHLLQVH